MRYVKGPNKGAVFLIETSKPAAFLAERKVEDVIEWLYNRPAGTDAAKERKKRLQGILADDRR